MAVVAGIPTALATTGAIANASGAQVHRVEAAAAYEPLILQDESIWYNIDRAPIPACRRWARRASGCYAQAGCVLTGESRGYNAANAAYGGVKPRTRSRLRAVAGTRGRSRDASPRSISRISLGGRPASPADGRPSTRRLRTGTSTSTTASCSAICTVRCRGGLLRSRDVGSKFDAVAMRPQVAF
jgi:phosphate-selective porin OprO and OprP